MLIHEYRHFNNLVWTYSNCQKNREFVNLAPSVHPRKAASYPTWEANILGSPSMQANKSRHIIIVIDHVFRWIKAVQKPNKKCHNLSHILQKFAGPIGMPGQIISDSGLCFE